MHRGYIKLWRKIQDWEWYDDSLTLWFFIKLVFLANWEEKQWHGITIKRGQFISSIEHLRFEHGSGQRAKRLTTKQVRTLLDRLKTTNELASESTNRFTLFSIVNYEKYQGDADERKGNPDGDPEGKQRASKGQQLKNIKNYKNEKIGTFSPPSLEDVKTYVAEISSPIDPEQFFSKQEAIGWRVGKNPMKDWRATIRYWGRCLKEKVSHANPNRKLRDAAEYGKV